LLALRLASERQQGQLPVAEVGGTRLLVDCGLNLRDNRAQGSLA